MLNLDTHIVVHLLDGRLRPRELAVIGDGPVGVSAPVLWELAKLRQLGRIAEGPDSARMEAFLSHCQIWPVDRAVALASARLDFRSDPADELIAATSIAHKVPLTRDEKLLASKVIPLANI
jgi:PIN domain nuclease of toxin-antitoxin system